MKRRLTLLALALLPALALCEPAKPAATAAARSPKVRLKTSEGNIVLELDAAKAPLTVANFLGYVSQKHYDGTVFHRVIDGFMIQGGGYALMDGKLSEKATGKGITNESQNGLKNARGTIAMARTSDPNSATAQFFINVKDNASLDYPSMGGYAVFGKVIEGLDVVDKIKAVPTGAADVPAKPVVIVSASVVQ